MPVHAELELKHMKAFLEFVADARGTMEALAKNAAGHGTEPHTFLPDPILGRLQPGSSLDNSFTAIWRMTHVSAGLGRNNWDYIWDAQQAKISHLYGWSSEQMDQTRLDAAGLMSVINSRGKDLSGRSLMAPGLRRGGEPVEARPMRELVRPGAGNGDPALDLLDFGITVWCTWHRWVRQSDRRGEGYSQGRVSIGDFFEQHYTVSRHGRRTDELLFVNDPNELTRWWLKKLRASGPLVVEEGDEYHDREPDEGNRTERTDFGRYGRYRG